MKRGIILFHFIYLFFLSDLYSQNLTSQIDEIVKDSLFEVSQIAIDVYDLSNEKYLYRKNENLIFRPASNMKLLTTAASLLYLGIDNNFKTTFIAGGSIVDSILKGDLIVAGGFDPIFCLNDLDSIAMKLRSLGVKKINGNIIADVSNIDSLYFGKGWMWDDNPGSYMPYLSSLNINSNSLIVYYSPAKIGEHANINFNPTSSYFTFENNLITTDEDTSNVIIDRDWLNESNHIIISGDISYKQKLDSIEVNLISPAKFFLTLLTERLNNYGITTSGDELISRSTTKGDTLFSVKRNILKVIHEANKESDNLSAEMLLRKLSAENFPGSASAKKGMRLLDSLVTAIGLSPQTYVFADGSGLSHYNLISASLIVELLKYFYFKKPLLYGFLYNSLPIAGVDGTLKNRMRYGRAFKNVHAKTGTISGVSNLSGYVNSKSGSIIAFSILIQNYAGSAKKARSIQDKICNILAEY